MGVKKYFFLLLSIVVFLVPELYAQDTSTTLSAEADCFALCTSKDYVLAAECYMKTRSKSDSFLAAATCAFNNYDDDVAEEYAIKSAKIQERWMKLGLLIPGVKEKIRTGGLAETYMLAHAASGLTRYKEESLKYTYHSGQCKDITNTDARKNCAQNYYNTTVSRYLNRAVLSSRTGINVDKLALQGKVTMEINGTNVSMKYVRIILECGSNKLKTETDSNGKYGFPIDADKVPCTQGFLYVIFQYRKDNKNYFTIKYKNKPIIVRKKFTLSVSSWEKDLTQNIALMNGEDMDASIYGAKEAPIRYIHHFYLAYNHMTEALEFWKDYMHANVDYKLPIDVQMFAKPPAPLATSTFYDPYSNPARAQIVINKIHAKSDNPYRPMNREWHEFSHHVMFVNYGKFPWVSIAGQPPQKNHAGFINPSTSDAYLEGFAEWGAMIIADYYNYSDPWLYSNFGSYDENWLAFKRLGKKEERSVANILWDFYDQDRNSQGLVDDDRVSIPLADIWGILKSYHQDFSTVYKKFVDNYPAKKSQINEILINNGYWIDTAPAGNGIHDNDEPYWDKNNNKAYDTNDIFVDYGRAGLPFIGNWMVHDANETIGSAADPGRPWRKNTVELAGERIKVDNKVPYYSVKVDYPNDKSKNYQVIVFNADGYISVSVPPGEINAIVTVVPIGVSYSNPLTFTASEFENSFPKSEDQGYYVKHDFGISGQINKEDLPDSYNIAAVGYWEKEGEGQEYNYAYVDSEEDINSALQSFGATLSVPIAGTFPIGFIKLSMVVVVLIVVYLVYDNHRKKKLTKDNKTKE
ncbi:hypothetical protein JW756_07205 [Candidatus Woesearchaeota archaeon]|nr:hypothetical protein [Candidatus Woesearchaeota archaeon]